MGILSKAKPNENFVPNKRQVNAIKGLIVGTNEGLMGASTGYEFPDIEWAWIRDNIPAASVRMDELIDAGFAWEQEWFEGDVSMGLTDHGVDWAKANLGLPDNFAEACSSKEPIYDAFVAGLGFQRRRKHDHQGASREGQAMGVASVSRWVRQTGYTRQQAEQAVATLKEAVIKGEMSPGSARAYHAHITRRTVA